nr:MAG TPA: hypothetical protein [Caudoviricetes sp.]
MRNNLQFNVFDYIPTPKNLVWIEKAIRYRFNVAEGAVRSRKRLYGLSSLC